MISIFNKPNKWIDFNETMHDQAYIFMLVVGCLLHIKSSIHAFFTFPLTDVKRL